MTRVRPAAMVLVAFWCISGCSVNTGPNPLGDPPAGDQILEVDPPPTPAPKNNQGMQALKYGLVWSFTSQQFGLGNVSDPALLELPDGTLRLFFVYSVGIGQFWLPTLSSHGHLQSQVVATGQPTPNWHRAAFAASSPFVAGGAPWSSPNLICLLIYPPCNRTIRLCFACSTGGVVPFAGGSRPICCGAAFLPLLPSGSSMQN